MPAKAFLQAQDAPRNEPASSTPAEPGYLGVLAVDSPEGALLREVVGGSPAETAGLQAGDVVRRVAERPIQTAREFVGVLSGFGPGEAVLIEFVRSGFLQTAEPTLGVRPRVEERRYSEFGRVAPMPHWSVWTPYTPLQTLLEDRAPLETRLGLRTLSASPAALRRRRLPNEPGALVAQVRSDSPADLAGIPVGALIVAVNDAPVRTPQELSSAIAHGGNLLRLTYYAGTESLTCELRTID